MIDWYGYVLTVSGLEDMIEILMVRGAASMNPSAIKKLEIENSLFRAPDRELDKIKRYIDALLADSGINPPEKRSLKGIWEDKGFEKISSLEGELESIRRQAERSILKRNI